MLRNVSDSVVEIEESDGIIIEVSDDFAMNQSDGSRSRTSPKFQSLKYSVINVQPVADGPAPSQHRGKGASVGGTFILSEQSGSSYH